MALTRLDQFITQFDRALRTLSPAAQTAARRSPAADVLEDDSGMQEQDKRHAAGLMRVNHSGEVCAQALYQGQALTAQLASVRQEMEVAAAEEVDHLAWCEERLNQLNNHTSVLNPLWYGLSFTIGASAGLVSDKISLGFVAATEEQVAQHLTDHLEKLPHSDKKSRAIVQVMLEDEKRHGQNALKAGGKNFPRWLKSIMTAASKLMTASSYRI